MESIAEFRTRLIRSYVDEQNRNQAELDRAAQEQEEKYKKDTQNWAAALEKCKTSFMQAFAEGAALAERRHELKFLILWSYSPHDFTGLYPVVFYGDHYYLLSYDILNMAQEICGNSFKVSYDNDKVGFWIEVCLSLS
jgi:hypothetical protein